MSYEEDQIDRLYDEVIYLRRDNERLARNLEVIRQELKAWKEYVNHIIELKAEVLLTQSLQPIIVLKDSELRSSAAVVAAKGKDKEAP